MSIPCPRRLRGAGKALEALPVPGRGIHGWQGPLRCLHPKPQLVVWRDCPSPRLQPRPSVVGTSSGGLQVEGAGSHWPCGCETLQLSPGPSAQPPLQGPTHRDARAHRLQLGSLAAPHLTPGAGGSRLPSPQNRWPFGAPTPFLLQPEGPGLETPPPLAAQALSSAETGKTSQTHLLRAGSFLHWGPQQGWGGAPGSHQAWEGGSDPQHPRSCAPAPHPKNWDCGRVQRPRLQGGLGISGQREVGQGVGQVSRMLGISFPPLRSTCSRLSPGPSEPLALGPAAGWMGLTWR